MCTTLLHRIDLLNKEMDKIEKSQYIGIECDSDEEFQEDESDVDYQSDDASTSKGVDYDIDKMFQIIKYRDFNKWSMSHIHNRFKQIHDGENGRKQLSR